MFTGRRAYKRQFTLWVWPPGPERPTSSNPGLKIFVTHFVSLLRVTFYVIITVSRVKAQRYFVSSSDLFLDKKTLLENWLNPGLNLTTFRETGPWILKDRLALTKDLRFLIHACIYLSKDCLEYDYELS